MLFSSGALLCQLSLLWIVECSKVFLKVRCFPFFPFVFMCFSFSCCFLHSLAFLKNFSRSFFVSICLSLCLFLYLFLYLFFLLFFCSFAVFSVLLSYFFTFSVFDLKTSLFLSESSSPFLSFCLFAFLFLFFLFVLFLFLFFKSFYVI